MPLTKKGKEIMSSMKSQYGSKKGKQVFYASKNAGKISGVDKGFFGHGTHESMQAQEDSINTTGDGFHDAAFPKSPTTDSFYNNVSNWKR